MARPLDQALSSDPIHSSQATWKTLEAGWWAVPCLHLPYDQDLPLLGASISGQRPPQPTAPHDESQFHALGAWP